MGKKITSKLRKMFINFRNCDKNSPSGIAYSHKYFIDSDSMFT